MPRGGLKKKKAQRNKQGRNARKRGKNGGKSAKTNSAQASPKQVPAQGASLNVGVTQQKGKNIPDNYENVYSRYKAATKQVFDYLQEFALKKNLAEGEKKPEEMTLDSLIKTVDWMKEANVCVDPDALKDLKFLIRVRTKVGISVFGAGESGHKDLLDTLVYCWRVLDSLPRSTKKSTTSEKDDDELVSDLSKALKESGKLEDNETAMNEEIFSSQDAPRPSLDGEPMLLEEVLFVDDRIDVMVFLFALETLMGCVAGNYSRVAETADRIKKEKLDCNGILPSILAATITTNMTIQQVQKLELEFELHNPHLTTVYRMLSVAVFSDGNQRLVDITRKHGRKACSTREASLFTGDCLECVFRGIFTPEDDTVSEIISDFASRFDVNSKGRKSLEDAFKLIWFTVVTEIPILFDPDIPKDPKYPSFSPYSWFPHFDVIGGDRAIHHTLRLLEWFGLYVKQCKEDYGHKCPKAMPGLFGPSPWQPGKSTKIHTDLDELLLTEILPCWFFMSTDEMYDFSLPPEQSQLAPLWCCIRDFARSPEKPAKWSEVFAVHAILTAILETDKVVHEIAPVCQKTFDLYFDQLNVALEHKEEVDGRMEPLRTGCTDFIQFISFLGQDLNFGPLAQWNPFCAGSILHYLNFQANIDYGAQILIDDRSQLKIVLHFYNALLANDLLQHGDIPLLDGLYSGFENSKKLWGGSLPRKGKFVEQFWLSMEGRLSVSQELITKVSSVDDNVPSNPKHLGMIKLLFKNESKYFKGTLPPAEFSTSFRRIFQGDFHDLSDAHNLSEPPPALKRLYHQDLLPVVHRMNGATRALMNDCELIAVNMPACGAYLDEFVCSMSRLLDWDVFKEEIRGQFTNWDHPQRIADQYMFASSVLKVLDDDAKYPSELDRIKDFVTSFMLPFFQKFSKENKCIWIARSSTTGRVEKNEHVGDQQCTWEPTLVD